MKLVHNSNLQIYGTTPTTPAPTPIEPGGTYAHSPLPEPPYLGYWLPLAITKTPPFPGFLGKCSRDYGQKIPPFPEKTGIRMRPPYAFEWGPGVLQVKTEHLLIYLRGFCSYS